MIGTKREATLTILVAGLMLLSAFAVLAPTLAARNGPAVLDGNSHLVPAVCSYPTVVTSNSSAKTYSGGPPVVWVHLAVTSGDTIAVIGAFATAIASLPNPSLSMSDGVNSYTLLSQNATFIHSATLGTNTAPWEAVWTAKAASTTVVNISLSGGGSGVYGESAVAYDIAGSAFVSSSLNNILANPPSTLIGDVVHTYGCSLVITTQGSYGVATGYASTPAGQVLVTQNFTGPPSSTTYVSSWDQTVASAGDVSAVVTDTHEAGSPTLLNLLAFSSLTPTCPYPQIVTHQSFDSAGLAISIPVFSGDRVVVIDTGFATTFTPLAVGHPLSELPSGNSDSFTNASWSMAYNTTPVVQGISTTVWTTSDSTTNLAQFSTPGWYWLALDFYVLPAIVGDVVTAGTPATAVGLTTVTPTVQVGACSLLLMHGTDGAVAAHGPLTFPTGWLVNWNISNAGSFYDHTAWQKFGAVLGPNSATLSGAPAGVLLSGTVVSYGQTPTPPPTPLCGNSVFGNASSGTLTLPGLAVTTGHSVLVGIGSENPSASIAPPSDGTNTYSLLTYLNDSLDVSWSNGVEGFSFVNDSWFYAMAFYTTQPTAPGVLSIHVDTGHDVVAIAWEMCRLVGHPDFTNANSVNGTNVTSQVATSFDNESVVSLVMAQSGPVSWSSPGKPVNQTTDHAGFPFAEGGVYDSGAHTYGVSGGRFFNTSSSEVNGQVQAMSLFNAPPKPPTGVGVSSVNATNATVTWVQPTQDENNNATVIVNETAYLFLGSACSGGGVGFSTGGPATSMLLSGLALSTSFSTYVTAWNNFGQSNASTCVPFITLGVPLAPTNVTTTTIGFTNATVTWTQSTGGGIVNNTVYLFSGSTCSGVATVYSTGGPATSQVLSSLFVATIYSVNVTSWNATGQSVASSCVSFRTLAPVFIPGTADASLLFLIVFLCSMIMLALLILALMRIYRERHGEGPNDGGFWFHW